MIDIQKPRTTLWQKIKAWTKITVWYQLCLFDYIHLLGVSESIFLSIGTLFVMIASGLIYKCQSINISTLLSICNTIHNQSNVRDCIVCMHVVVVDSNLKQIQDKRNIIDKYFFLWVSIVHKFMRVLEAGFWS